MGLEISRGWLTRFGRWNLHTLRFYLFRQRIKQSDLLLSISLLIQDRFEDWEATGVRLVPVLSQPDDLWKGERGYIQVWFCCCFLLLFNWARITCNQVYYLALVAGCIR